MTTATKKTNKKIQVACPKCGGTGYIPRYAGIANGVCFTCKGNKTVLVSVSKPAVKPLTEYQATTIERIKTESGAGLSYKTLLNLRDFCHWHYPQEPNLLSIWRDRGWEGHFQARQAERLAEFHATRGW